MAIAQDRIAPPAPYGPVPSERQLRWHEVEFYRFLHFTMNTFTDKEWGYGDESPALFSPSDFDANEIARLAKEVGMKGLILTAKHHDGFCLWPSQYTGHSVKNSAWKAGEGDVVKEIAEACRRYELKFGVYLSPWDRHHRDYGKPEYIIYYRNQLQELLTNSGETCWATYSPVGEDGGEPAPGDTRYREGVAGHHDGKFWPPAECDVSIRPGWFYHAREDSSVKSPAHLFDLYFQSVGRNASLLLNIPPDRRGRVHEKDVSALQEFKRLLDQTFVRDFAAGATVTASNVRGKDLRFSANNLMDSDKATYWATDDAVTTALLAFTLREKSTFNSLMLQEHIALGQRVEAFAVEYWNGSAWTQVASGTTIGHKRLLCFPDVTTDKVRLIIHRAKACPAIARFALFKTPANH